MHNVHIIVKEDHYDPSGPGVVWWNLASDYNEGYRATDGFWEWINQQGVEVDEWDIIQDYDDGNDVVPGQVVFAFKDPAIATLFKLTWG